MSTKTTRKYIQVNDLTIHLYDDFKGFPVLEIQTKKQITKIILNKSELEYLDKQFK